MNTVQTMFGTEKHGEVGDLNLNSLPNSRCNLFYLVFCWLQKEDGEDKKENGGGGDSPGKDKTKKYFLLIVEKNTSS